ncbi:MAG TPA: M48 family metallopeptidase [archaeon]|nr:M48 family metallopeptidase [archaeon]
MPKILLVILILAPFIAWDAAVYVMRQQGDRSLERRSEVLRHFTQDDIKTGRDHLLRHNRLFPFYRLLFYAFYTALLFGGLGVRLENSLLQPVGGRWYLALPLFILALLAARTLLYMPVSAYSEFVIEREMGLSTISVGLWLSDRLKSLLLNWVIVSLVAFPLLALVKALPRFWPVPAAVVVLAISAFGIWISPWVIDPIFNKFTPLEDKNLTDSIRTVSAEAGLTVRQVYVMDASRRSLYLNAYFTGLGNSRRVVLYDTLVRECDPDEVLSVVAHELGHWKANHIMKGFLIEAAGVFLGFWLLWALLNNGAVRGFFGLPGPSSMVLIVLLPFLTSFTGTLTAPFVSAISRRFERQADRIALELTDNSRAFIELEKKLVRKAKADLLQPELIQLFYGSHPLPEDRIRMAEDFSRESPRSSKPAAVLLGQ